MQDAQLKEICKKPTKLTRIDFLSSWYRGSKKKIKNIWHANYCHMGQIVDRDEALEVCAKSQMELIQRIRDYESRILNLQKENSTLKNLLNEKGNLRRTA